MIIHVMTTQAPIRLVIAGGGFGGIRLARHLCRSPRFQVTLITPDDTFAYYPQLYHAATGGTRSESALPLADMFAGCRIELVKDKVATLDPDAHTITTEGGRTVPYDKLALALGSVTNYFGVAGLAEFSYDIKTIAGAERFKAHLHQDLAEDQLPDVNYVIVGGGPTGIELAAALGEYLQRITQQHGLKQPKYEISIIEAAPRLLPRSPEAFAARIHRRLRSLGVQVLTGVAVEGETAEALRLKDKDIPTHTVVWTAGVANNPFYKANAQHFTLAKNGKVEVDEYLLAKPDVYVMGDNASTPYSGMAQTAIYDADFVGNDLMMQATGHPRHHYHPKAPISVIPVGGRWAAVQWGPVRLYGIIGWLLRRAADLIAYTDVEDLGPAIRVWLQDSRHEDKCPICDPVPLASQS
jgi:NADH:ubiquinone reductase (H+-translocating)